MILRSTRNISNSREYVNNRLKEEESSPLLQRKPISIEESVYAINIKLLIKVAVRHGRI